MKERPILFTGPMVRAILDGRKTQTRRVIKAKNLRFEDGVWQHDVGDSNYQLPCPYGQPGDRLWVRETWAKVPETAYWHDQSITHKSLQEEDGYRWWSVYKASWDRSAPSWRPSIHMPRWASRITLEVVSVRVERLQDISVSDAPEEGLLRLKASGRYCLTQGDQHLGLADHNPRVVFANLWDSINAKRGFGWDTNPWVWVVEFRRVTDG